MSQFSDNTWFDVEHCCNCGIAFAMTTDLNRRLRESKASFYCPAGHAQHYTGKTKAQRLADELAREKEKREASDARARKAENESVNVSRAHKRMRERVANGVCPCCNRSFSNLREHMKTQHADFRTSATLVAIRQAFGMTQQAVAKEAYVHVNHVSAYEREKPVPGYAKERLDHWLNKSTAPKV